MYNKSVTATDGAEAGEPTQDGPWFNPLTTRGQARLAALLKEAAGAVDKDTLAEDLSRAFGDVSMVALGRYTGPAGTRRGGRGATCYLIMPDSGPPYAVSGSTEAGVAVHKSSQTIHNMVGRGKGAWHFYWEEDQGILTGAKVVRLTADEERAWRQNRTLPDRAKPQRGSARAARSARLARDREEEKMERELQLAKIVPETEKARTTRKRNSPE